MIWIASQTVGAGGAASVTFSNIPQTFAHLQFRISARSNRTSLPNDVFRLRFNGDSAANYKGHTLYGTGSSAASGVFGEVNEIVLGDTTGPTAVSGNFSVVICDILDYTSTTKNKVTRTLGGFDNNGSGTVSFNSGLYISTNAITSVFFQPIYGTQFLENTRFDLYGFNTSPSTGA